jgi:hypothetical protein
MLFPTHHAASGSSSQGSRRLPCKAGNERPKSPPHPIRIPSRVAYSRPKKTPGALLRRVSVCLALRGRGGHLLLRRTLVSLELLKDWPYVCHALSRVCAKMCTHGSRIKTGKVRHPPRPVFIRPQKRSGLKGHGAFEWVRIGSYSDGPCCTRT